MLDVSDLAGLGIIVPDGVTGDFDLTVESIAYEAHLSDTELDISNNRAGTQAVLKLHIEVDDVPVVSVSGVGVDESDLGPDISVSGTVGVDFGADGPGTVEGNGAFNNTDLTAGRQACECNV